MPGQIGQFPGARGRNRNDARTRDPSRARSRERSRESGEFITRAQEIVLMLRGNAGQVLQDVDEILPDP